jgi:hypothetical protein
LRHVERLSDFLYPVLAAFVTQGFSSDKNSTADLRCGVFDGKWRALSAYKSTNTAKGTREKHQKKIKHRTTNVILPFALLQGRPECAYRRADLQCLSNGRSKKPHSRVTGLPSARFADPRTSTDSYDNQSLGHIYIYVRLQKMEPNG